MTCQECELALGGEDRGAEVEGHLAGCGACRDFARELSANGDALRLMAVEPMPSVVIRQTQHWPFVAAAVAIAAMIVLALALRPHPDRVIQPAAPIARVEPAPPEIREPVIVHKPRRVPRKNVQPEILQVKMLTADPNVVIYWQIENKKGTE